MKLQKIKLNELADAELNEREMCHILGGGEPGCCQCGCHGEGTGGSSSASNDSANNAKGLTSDPGADPCPGPTVPPPPRPTQPASICGEEHIHPQDALC